VNAYHNKLERVFDYIKLHLDDALLDLNHLAEIAHLSPYHFHRIYHAINGETVAATVRRLRLGRAASDVARGQLSAQQIATRAGYGSVQAFGRSFKGEFGMPPAQYKEHGTHRIFHAPVSDLVTKIEVVEIPMLQGWKLEHRGSYMLIEQAFRPMMQQAVQQQLEYSSVLGIYPDDPNAVVENNLRSYACLVFDKPPKPINPVTVFTQPTLRCAVLRHRGAYADMRFAYQWLYGQWLLYSGFAAADAPVFEVYLNHPQNTAPTDLLVDICLPLDNLI
jgi:AraC family transcriptional regulator